MSTAAISPTRFSVTGPAIGQRLDSFLAQSASVSRRQARLWIGSGRVRVRGRAARILTRPLRDGDMVELDLAAAAPSLAPVAPAALRLLYLDPHVVVVAKPSGLLSEPDRLEGPAVTSLLPRLLQARGEADRLWLVHRLDAGTSGVLVLARRPQAAARLSAAFRDGQAHKRYLALCQGQLTAARVSAPLGRLAGSRQGVVAEGRAARTDLVPLATASGVTLVGARPHTGRTHQIRVHLAHVGHPILGDRLYGGPGYGPPPGRTPIGRFMLHALALTLPHPATGEPMTWRALPPPDLRAVAAIYGIDVAIAATAHFP